MCVLFLSPHNGDAAGAQTRWQSCWRLQQLALVQVVESLLVFWALLGLAWPYWALFGLTVPSWALLDLTKCFKRLFSIWVWGLTDIVQYDLCAFAYFFFLNFIHFEYTLCCLICLFSTLQCLIFWKLLVIYRFRFRFKAFWFTFFFQISPLSSILPIKEIRFWKAHYFVWWPVWI